MVSSLNHSVNRWYNHVSVFLICFHQVGHTSLIWHFPDFKEIANNAICNDLVSKCLLLFGSQFSKVQEIQVCFMLSVRTTMPRLSVVDRGRAVGMLEGGMAALAVARQHNVHATTICRRNARQTARERPGLHQDRISDQTVRNRLRAANLRCRRP